MIEVPKGLEGVVATDTALSFIDGTEGVLEYVGISIGDLASHSTFEETVYLLWNQKLPTQGELDAFSKALRDRYALPKGMLERIQSIPADAQPMHMLRTMVSALSFYDDDPNANDPAQAQQKSLNVPQPERRNAP